MTGFRRRTWVFALFALCVAAPGCVTHDLLPDDFARSGVAWSGPPIPLTFAVGEIRVAEGLEPPFLGDVARRSLVNVLDRSRIVAGVRALDGGAPPAAVDFVLSGEVRSYDLYSSYAWWGVYGAFLVIPLPATSVGAIIMIVAGSPVVVDRGELELVIDATDARTGKLAGRYRCDFKGIQPSSVWESPRVDESYVAHPELLFQHACGRIAQQIGQDRFWLLRWKNKQ